MYFIEINKVMAQIISFFYRIGFWHRGDEPTVRELIIKTFYCFYYLFFPISLVVGSVKSDNEDESIFLAEISIAVLVVTVKMPMLIWRQKEILDALNRISVFSVKNHDDFNFVNKKLSKFMKFVIVLIILLNVAAVCDSAIPPFIGDEKKLFFKIGFPMDYINDEIAFWAASVFIFTEIYLTTTVVIFSVTFWYLMICCSLRYEVLGNEIRNLGLINKKEISVKEKQNIFLKDLNALIDAHHCIKECNDVTSII